MVAPTRASKGETVPSAAPVRAAKTQAPITEPDGVASRLSAGQTLVPSTRTRMENAFGTSFAGVRVHTGGSAAEVTSAHAAEALTVGGDVAFAPGAYQPGTPAGEHLIAHELAHVVQQSGSPGVAQPSAIVSTPGEPAEAAADRAADTVLAGGRVTMPAGLTTRRRIMRRARMAGPTLPALSFSAPAAGFGGQMTPLAEARAGPVESSMISPAGGRMLATVGHAGQAATRSEPPGAAPPAPKSPDEAQTAIAAEQPAPPSVAVAGASAEQAAGEPDSAAGAGGRGQKRKEALEKKKGEIAEDAKKEEKQQEEHTEAAEERVEARRARTLRFGQNLGDRGAARVAAAAQRIASRAGAMRVREPGQQRVDGSQAAAEPPANENSSRAEGGQVAVVAASKPPVPSATAAGREIRQAVDRAAPHDMEEMGNMDSRSGEVSSAVQGAVGTQVEGVTSTLSKVNDAPATDAPGPPPPESNPMAPPPTRAPDMAAATPPPVPEESLDASEFSEAAEGELAQHDVDDQTLQRADEGPLAGIAADKSELDNNVERAAADVRAGEAPALEETAGGLADAEATGDMQMSAQRERGQTRVTAEQDATRTGAHTDRGNAADEIEGMARAASEEVTGKLDALRNRVTTEFDKQQQDHLKSFNTGTRNDLEAYKDERYSGWFGWGRWIKDRFVSINELRPVKDIYQRNYDRYMQRIDALVATLTADIETTISESLRMLNETRVKIQEKIESLPKKLRKDAEAAGKRAEQSFRRMEQQVADAGQQMRDELVQRRERAVTAVDEALKQIQEENLALVDKIKNAIKRLVELIGKFLRLMTRVTRMGVGNFISAAASQAVDGIRNNLWDELKTAFSEWLDSKFGIIQTLLSLPSNVFEMLTALATSLPQQFIENLPEFLPHIAVAAMAWLATSLAAKLIPGAGTIMLVIDGIRAAWSLVQSLLSAASAFFDFVMVVAGGGNGVVQFAKALARGIIAGLEALLTFLGVDRLIRRIAGAVLKPFGRLFGRLRERFRQWMTRRGRARDHAEGAHGRSRRREREEPGDPHQHRRDREAADHDEHTERRRRQDDDRHRQEAESHRDPRSRGDRDPAAARNRQREKERERDREEERRNRQRLDKAARELPAKIGALLQRGVTGIRLFAQLAFWRLRYRLSGLSVEQVGPGRFKVLARVNPEANVFEGVNLTGTELLRFIREVSRDIMNDPRSKLATRETRATRRRERGGGRDVISHEVTSPLGMIGVSQGMKHRGLWSREVLRFKSGTELLRRQGWGTVKNKIVQLLQRRKALRYLSTADRPESLASLLDRSSIRSAEDFRRFMQGISERVPGVDRSVTEELWGVLQQEALRSEAGLAQAAFIGQTAQAGVPFTQVLGASPMAPEGSQRAARETDEFLAGEAGAEPSQRVKDQMELEIAQIRLWVEALGLKFKDEVQAKKVIREKIYEFYGMSPGVTALGD